MVTFSILILIFNQIIFIMNQFSIYILKKTGNNDIWPSQYLKSYFVKLRDEKFTLKKMLTSNK